ncbi:hypothetical protein EPA93_25370 [Ktedonosporobacter rubrisoli]|uniref:Adhesin domain-containing protein n=1 Tax=Ktedonosporobacter rubrisoli TaxID=2509675 RepID=A0A4P6JUY0_KTERU|nr:hypothetical protein [Ktedonosporobacter rubrisoli]QBD79130.1 hypothetical protein EPA93_25370 [Ktedonosporobacter rubrisoli]
MFKQNFSVESRKPCVMLRNIEGDLKIYSWDRREIQLETAEPVQEVWQQDNVLTVANYRGDITLWVPAVRDLLFFVTTSIVVNGLRGKSHIDGVGNVQLEDVDGPAQLNNIAGNVRLIKVSEAATITRVAGNLYALHAFNVNVPGKVGGNAELHDIEQAQIDGVGGNLDADNVGVHLHCNRVSGNARVNNCQNAEISLQSVSGNLNVDNAAVMQSSSVSGNLQVYANFPAQGVTRLRAGGNATLILPDNASTKLRVRAGGMIRGSSVPYRIAHNATLVYGEGQANLELVAGGNIDLDGNLQMHTA